MPQHVFKSLNDLYHEKDSASNNLVSKARVEKLIQWFGNLEKASEKISIPYCTKE